MSTRIQDTIVGIAGLTFWAVLITTIAIGFKDKPFSQPSTGQCTPGWEQLC